MGDEEQPQWIGDGIEVTLKKLPSGETECRVSGPLLGEPVVATAEDPEEAAHGAIVATLQALCPEWDGSHTYTRWEVNKSLIPPTYQVIINDGRYHCPGAHRPERSDSIRYAIALMARWISTPLKRSILDDVEVLQAEGARWSRLWGPAS